MRSENFRSSHSNLCIAASASGHAETLNTLLRLGEVDLKRVVQESLFKAATNGHASIVKILMQQNTRLKPHMSLRALKLRRKIHFNLNEKDLDCNEKDIDHDKDIIFEKFDDIIGLTSLHSSAANGHVEVIRLLAKSYIDVDIKDVRTLSTPLYYTVKNGHAQVVAELLPCGASVEITDDQNITPFILAAKNGHLAVVKCLLADGSSINETGGILTLQATFSTDRPYVFEQCLSSPLMWAVANGHTNVVALLLDCDGMEYSVRGKITAVHLTAASGHAETLRMLLDRGARNTIGPHGANAFQFAAQNGHNYYIEILAGERKYLDSLTNWIDDAFRPLHVATTAGHCSTILLLGRLGAELKTLIFMEGTAFEISFHQKSEETALALLEAEEAQFQRPRLWRLSCILRREAFFERVRNRQGSTISADECIFAYDFNRQDIVYAKMLLRITRDLSGKLDIWNQLSSRLRALELS